MSGKYADIPLSLDELYFNLYNSDLINHVVSAKDIDKKNINKSLSELYLESYFNEPFMDLSNYQNAEGYGYDSECRFSILQMTIDMNDRVFSFGRKAMNPLQGEKFFLKVTNATLNDDIKDNDVSFNMSFLGRENVIYKNLYSFVNLEKGKIYKLTISGHNPNKLRAFAITPYFIYNNAILNITGSQTITKGVFSQELIFKAKNSEASLLLESCNNTYIRIFGIKVEMLNQR